MIANAGYRKRVEDNAGLLSELGQWGVPVLAFAGEAYWGQDRTEDLEQALRAAGLAKIPGDVAAPASGSGAR